MELLALQNVSFPKKHYFLLEVCYKNERRPFNGGSEFALISMFTVVSECECDAKWVDTAMLTGSESVSP